MNLADVENRLNMRVRMLANFKARTEKAKTNDKRVIDQLTKMIADDSSLLKFVKGKLAKQGGAS